MRLLFGSLAALPMMLVIGCTWVDPGECWPNTSGGFGGGGTIPIGAGVGATGSGDYITEPPKDPLDNSGTPNPCMASESQPQSTCQGEQPAADAAAFVSCTDACRSKCPAPGAFTVAAFSPAEFPFVTTVKDDGTDKGGGYQVAKANLKFEYLFIPLKVVIWYCPITIQMPLRTEKMGKVDATRAAILSEEITEGVARGMDFSLPQGIFCKQFATNVDAAFKSKYPGLAAGATNP
jgi:hypothetical protein